MREGRKTAKMRASRERKEDPRDMGLERQAGATFLKSLTLLILTACYGLGSYSRYWGSERGQNTHLTVTDLQSWQKRKIVSQLSKIWTMTDVNSSGGKIQGRKEDLKCLGCGRTDISDTGLKRKPCWGDFRVKDLVSGGRAFRGEEHKDASVAEVNLL